MKKCPTCEKTFEDNLKFCQADGTPLVAAEEPEDPYKTTVANASDLPIPPLDMFKTMVADPLPPKEQKVEVEEELPVVELASEISDVEEPPAGIPAFEEPKLSEPEQEIDLLKTMIATDFPPFKRSVEPEVIEEPKFEAPPSPFDSTPVETVAEPVEEIKVEAPEPPKFSEPEIKPPSFGETDSEPEQVAVDLPVEPAAVAEQDAPTGIPFGNSDPRDNRPNDLTSDSPYGDVDNVPIPSPFDLSMPPGYQVPSAPFPQNKEAEGIPPGGSPFANDEIHGNQQLEGQGWNPPASPNADWQENQIGQNTPFQPPVGGVKGQDKTLAFVSLGLGGLGVLILLPSLIITICGIGSFLLGIGAIITGFLGRSRANSQPEQYGGSGLATGGLVLGVLSVLGPIAIVILYVVIFAGAGFLNSR